MKRALLALTLATSTALAAPAMAGGTLSFNFDARNGDDANAIRTGLALYSIYNDVKSNGHVSQRGLNNMAALGQRGSGNVGIVHQDGNNHHGSLNHAGNNNSYGGVLLWVHAQIAPCGVHRTLGPGLTCLDQNLQPV